MTKSSGETNANKVYLMMLKSEITIIPNIKAPLQEL